MDFIKMNILKMMVLLVIAGNKDSTESTYNTIFKCMNSIILHWDFQIEQGPKIRSFKQQVRDGAESGLCRVNIDEVKRSPENN